MQADLLFLADVFARSAVVILLALVAIGLLPKLSAAARGWLWLLAIGALPLVPLSTALTPGVTLFKVEAPAEPIAVKVAKPAAVPKISVSVPVVREKPTAPVVSVTTPEPASVEPVAAPVAGVAPRLVPLIYGVGVLICLIPLMVGLLHLRALRRRAMPAPLERFPQLTKGEILLSDDITVPLTWGTRRPVVLLPTAALEWPAERVRVVLAHEFAHIERRDFASGLFASVVRALFWFQPLSWFAHRRLRAEREIACDDRVLAGEATAAPDYAEHLSAVASGGGRLMEPAVAMARPSEIVGRVRAILDSARNRAALSGRRKAQLATIGLAVISPLAFVRCMGQDEKAAKYDTHKTGTGIQMHAIDPAAVTFINDGDTLEVPGGAAYAMAEREVTQAEFQQLMGHNPSPAKADHLPVTRVTLTEAASFCKALTERDRAAGILPKGKVYRLPTLREWVLAGLPGGIIPSAETIDTVAWHKDNSAGLLHPVGAKKANAYGLHDMLGNAAEWVMPDAALGKVLSDLEPMGYSAQTTIQYVPSAGFRPDATTYGTVIATQMEIIKAAATLSGVVEELSLSKQWAISSDECLTKLKSNLQTNPLRGTDLAQIRYNDSDPDMAAKIANAIALSYRKRQDEFSAQQAAKVTESFEAQIAVQSNKLEESRVKMLDTMEKYWIVDISKGGPAWMRGETVVQNESEEEKSEQDSLAQRRQSIEYVESKKDYELNKEMLNSMKTQLAEFKIDSRSPRSRVVIHELAVPSEQPSSTPASTPMAIGGTIFDPADDLADPTSTDPEARTEGVGFRFVLADE